MMERVRRNIQLLQGLTGPCAITPRLREKLKAIGYRDEDIPKVVKALCFETYRKKPKKGYRYLLLGVDEFGLVDCGGDYTSEIIPLTIIHELKRRPEESDWTWVYIFDQFGREVLKERIK